MRMGYTGQPACLLSPAYAGLLPRRAGHINLPFRASGGRETFNLQDLQTSWLLPRPAPEVLPAQKYFSTII
jgi:hypothetical protein